MDITTLYVVSFLLGIILCALFLFLAKRSVRNIDISKDLQIVRRADRPTGHGGYFYADVPMGLLPYKSWERPSSVQIAVRPALSKSGSVAGCGRRAMRFSPFLMACWKCDYYRMKSLLENGADPCQKTDEGASGMVLCAYRMASDDARWNSRCLKLLFNAGCAVDEPTKEENTALHLAVKKRSIIVVHWLLQHGADIHKGNQAGWSPYELAVCSGDIPILNLITKYEFRQAGPNTPRGQAIESASD